MALFKSAYLRKNKSASRRKKNRPVANKRRQGKLAVIIPWCRRFGMIMGVLIFGIWMTSWFFISGAAQSTAEWAHDKAMETSVDMGFTLENIMLEGRTHADPAIVMAIINMQKSDPILSFNPAEAKEQIERISWVREAQVERRLPDTIYIKLNERRPLALWQVDNQIFLLDEHGDKISTTGVSRFKNLIKVSGLNAPAHASHIIKDINALTDLKPHIKEAIRISDRRWNLKTNAGTIIYLPEKNADIALKRLVDAQKSDKILDARFISLDLRPSDRIITKAPSGQADGDVTMSSSQSQKTSDKQKTNALGNPI